MAINSSAKNVIPIGVVLSIAGYVALKGTDGLQKILQLGDLLRSDDHIKTGPDGELVIGFIDGTALELGAKIEAILDSEVFDLSALKPISNLEEALEAMRLSILTGEDPSLVLQSAEAGYDSLSAAGSEPAGVNIDSTSDSASVTVEDSLANTTMQGGSVSQSAMGADSGVHTPPEMVLPKVSIASVTILEPTPGNPEEDADEGHDTTDTGHDTGDGHDTGGDTGHDTDTGHETDTGGGTDSGHDSGNDAGHSAGHGGGYGYAGGSLSSIATFTVALSAPSTREVRIDFTTVDGTAISGGSGVSEADYGQTSGTLVIPAGEMMGTIDVTVYADRIVEADEAFFIQLSNPVNAVIADGLAGGTILESGHGEGSEGEGDIVFGTPGDDVLETRGGPDTLYGLEGNDTLIAGGGPDVIHGGPGDDLLVGLGGPDELYGGEGNDEIIGHGGPDIIDGGPGDDIIYAGGAPDMVSGGEGDDFINAEGGPDTVDAGPGNDIVYGEGGPDSLSGGEGNDSLYGGGGPDILQGGSGDDQLFGGGGPDVLTGGPGADVLKGGEAGDVFRFEALGDGIDRIVDFDQHDQIDISAILDIGAGDPISNYVQITQSGADQFSYELNVNPTGSSDPTDFQTLVVLENMQATPDVDELVTNGNLIVIE